MLRFVSKMLLLLVALIGACLAVACDGGGGPSRTASPGPSVGGVTVALPTSTATVTVTPPTSNATVTVTPPTSNATVTVTPPTSNAAVTATQAPLGPEQPISLEEGATVTETGTYVMDVESGRVWKVSEFATGQWSPDGSALMILGSSIGVSIDLVDIEEGSAVRILSDDVAAAAWSPDGSRIAFSGHIDGTKGLYVIDSDGSGLKLRSERGAYALEWSAKGDHIAFLDSPDHVYVLEVASGETVDLADVGGYALAWSPNGAELAFTNESGLYVYDAETGERRQVAVGPSGGPILWSPDGSRIAFRFGPRVAMTRGIDAGNPNAGFRILHVVEVDGSGDPKPLPPARSVSWSPDGTKITYLSEGCITAEWDIYTVDPDGGWATRLTNTPETFKEGPFWSPTGATIAFETSDDLMLLNAESGKIRTLASGGPQSGGPGIHLHDPPWSPDGRYILFGAGGAHGICD
jgi:Tol biopolymer transport system component